MTPIENILQRLDKVRQRQPGQWSARCPAHDDSGPSLSIRETPEGAVLLHCFAGCEVGHVVSSIGLQLHDLYPPRDTPHGTTKRIARLLTAGQALELLSTETTLVAVAASTLANGRLLTQNDKTRLMQSAGRINFLRDQTTGQKNYA